MRTSLLLLSAFLALTCQKDQPVAPVDDGAPPSSTTAVIGSAGGTLAAEGFSLLIPEGAFSAAETLRVTNLGASQEFGTDALTPLFRVDGLPPDVGHPLRVELRLLTTPTTEPRILIGGQADDPLTGEAAVFNDDIAASVQGETLGAQIPSSQPARKVRQGSLAGPAGDDFERVKWFLGINNVDTLLSDGGHFRVLYRRYMEGPARTVAQHFENAYQALVDAGFNKTGMYGSVAWPCRIEIKNFTGENAGALIAAGMQPMQSSNIPGGVGMLMRVALDESKLTAGVHSLGTACALAFSGFLAGIQKFALQIKNPFWSEREHAYHLWLLVSVVEWAQELVLPVAERSSFVSSAFLPNWKVPFGGLPLSEGANARIHGVGWSPLMKHLAERHGGPQTVAAAFHAMLNVPRGTDALLASVSDPENAWLPAFFRRYISGELCGVSAATMLQAVSTSDVFTIDDNTDSLREFTASYSDLSARLYRINLRHPGLSDDASIRFSVGPGSLNMDYVQVQLFVLKDGTLEFLDAGTDVTMTGVKALAASGQDIIAAVVNSANESPYNEKMAIDLTVRLQTSRGARVGMSLWMWGWYIGLDGEGRAVVYYAPAYSRRGTLDGSGVFRAAWDDTVLAVRYTGTMTIGFDLASSPPRVTSFAVVDTMQAAGWTEYWEIGSGGPCSIPGIAGSSSSVFSLQGESVAGQLGLLQHSIVAPGMLNRLDRYWADPTKSEIIIQLDMDG